MHLYYSQTASILQSHLLVLAAGALISPQNEIKRSMSLCDRLSGHCLTTSHPSLESSIVHQEPCQLSEKVDLQPSGNFPLKPISKRNSLWYFFKAAGR